MTNEELLDFWAQADYEQGLVDFWKKNGDWIGTVMSTDDQDHMVIKYIWEDGKTFEVTY